MSDAVPVETTDPSPPGGAGAFPSSGGIAGRVRRLTSRRPERPDDWAHEPTESLTVTTGDGIALAVEIDAPENASRSRPHLGGRVPTVVFVHGFALSMQSWVMQRRALSHNGYRVVAYDHRGHGRSGVPSTESCTIAQLGRDLDAVVRATCPTGPVVLIGHSMGGMTVMSYAGQFPETFRERVLAVALVSTSPGGHEVIEFGLGATVGKVVGSFGPGVLTRLSRHAGPIALVRRMGKRVQDVAVERWSFGSPVSRDIVDQVATMIFDTPLDIMAAFLPDIDQLDLIPGLGAFHGIETLVINGDTDLVTPPSHSEKIVRAIPGAEHVVVKDAGHILQLEHPLVVTQQLLMLIQRAQRGVVEGTAGQVKPRVRRTIEDIAKRRRAGKAAKQQKPAKGTQAAEQRTVSANRKPPSGATA
jgi:pimeloyl-ACP methyl ester carboxylesterase